jgi:tRNA pseudouridine38-40 synthase
MEKLYRATIQYDGGAYYGFQRQKAGPPERPTIQAELEQALARLADRPVRVIGAGRTDTGVHALGQVIGFTMDWPARHGLDALRRALNANLPRDIAAMDVAEAPPGFHPRFDARRRTYEYYVLNAPTRQPLLRGRAWHIRQVLDVERMNAAAALLIGTHDFATFGRAPVGENTVRSVSGSQWSLIRLDAPSEICQVLKYRISADAFLYRMVRSVVGSLRAVGSGEWPVDRFAEALAACQRQESATLAPAHGLYLVSVEYRD